MPSSCGSTMPTHLVDVKCFVGKSRGDEFRTESDWNSRLDGNSLLCGLRFSEVFGVHSSNQGELRSSPKTIDGIRGYDRIDSSPSAQSSTCGISMQRISVRSRPRCLRTHLRWPAGASDNSGEQAVVFKCSISDAFLRPRRSTESTGDGSGRR